jgi:hypothetical protein
MISNMKKITILVLAALIFTSCGKQGKYTISSEGGQYMTNSYTKDANGCIVFKNECNCGGDPQVVTVCGTYTIIKNSSHEKE